VRRTAGKGLGRRTPRSWWARCVGAVAVRAPSTSIQQHKQNKSNGSNCVLVAAQHHREPALFLSGPSLAWPRRTLVSAAGRLMRRAPAERGELPSKGLFSFLYILPSRRILFSLPPAILCLPSNGLFRTPRTRRGAASALGHCRLPTALGAEPTVPRLTPLCFCCAAVFF